MPRPERRPRPFDTGFLSGITGIRGNVLAYAPRR
jgi:hypothetical protein